MRSGFVVATLLAVCLCAPTAEASCASAVVVRGVVLQGHQATGWELPPPDGRVRAVAPACNDGGPVKPDGETTVVRLTGIPPEVAVSSVDRDSLYLAPGSLTALAAHPLHRPSRRFARRHCARQTLEGRAGSAGHDSITLVAAGRERFVRLDARTTLSNQPAYQPVREGQALRIEARRCGTRLVADGIAFTGPTVVPKRYSSPRGSQAGGGGFPWMMALLIVALCLAAIGLVERITRP